MGDRQKIIQKLDELGIKYEITEHPAVFTIDEMDGFGISERGSVCKNLFLRNANGKKHYLVILNKDKHPNLKEIRNQIGSTALSFGSEKRLYEHLKLTKGAVTPFGIINDPDCTVEIIFDRDLIGNQKLGFHPNENTSTLWISFDDIKKFIEDNGNTITYIDV